MTNPQQTQVSPEQVAEETIEIPLTKGYTAIVDKKDYPLISGRSWYAHLPKPTKVYAACWGVFDGREYSNYRMHRLILGAKPGQVVDHINGNGLDNRRSNLRIVTYAENAHNRKRSNAGASSYLGVYKGSRNRWIARITCDGKPIYLGSFAEEVEAAIAYDIAVIQYRDSNATINFPLLRTSAKALLDVVEMAKLVAEHCKKHGTAPLDELVQAVEALSTKKGGTDANH